MASVTKALGDVLHDEGFRLTEPRRIVWDVLTQAGGHLTADEVADRVSTEDPSVNRSSIYRSLALFTDLGLVRESNLGGESTSYWEVAHPDDHFHVRCLSCGSVEHHADDVVAGVRAHLSEEHDFQAGRVDLIVSGLCRSCLAEIDG